MQLAAHAPCQTGVHGQCRGKAKRKLCSGHVECRATCIGQCPQGVADRQSLMSQPVLDAHAVRHAGPEHADGSPFNEEDWTDPSYKTVGPYVKSKVG